jgi:diadenosine tetraphosphate (Ap4A) HIT family hydrolase
MDSEAWHKRTLTENCPFCQQLEHPDKEDPHGFPLLELHSGRLRLSRNQTRYGYCIFVSRVHVLELHELSPDMREAFIHDVARISRAVQSLLGAEKMNVQFLGNAVPHLHAHIFPRYLADADFGRYPEDKTTAFTELEPEALRELREALTQNLGQSSA